MLKISTGDTETRIIAALEVKNERLMNALITKMTGIMGKVQEKARANAAGPYSKGALEDSITNPEAHAEGTSVVGTLQWGGGDAAPYARVQEEGGIKDLYAINPLGKPNLVGKALGGTRSRIKGTSRRFGSDVLRFIGSRDGKVVFAPQVFHPRVEGKHFMANALESSRNEIIEGLKEVCLGIMRETS